MRKQFDATKWRGESYEVGEIVFCKKAPNVTGQPTKTQPLYRGPLVITEVLPSDTYRIRQLRTSDRNVYAATAHVSQLRPWRNGNTSDDDNSDENDTSQED